MTGPLYKTTIVIWSEYDPEGKEIDSLARDAIDGDAYCSCVSRERITDPSADPAWDRTEFFDTAEEAIA